jgi:UDP-N-acetylmuramoyl-tripeptide--D-alanyl-D-alanine ligase
MHLFNKLIFSFAKPEVIIVSGKNKTLSADIIFSLLNDRFKVKRIERGGTPVLTGKEEVLIFKSDFSNEEEIAEAKFLLSQSSRFYLVATNVGDIRFDKEIIEGENRDAFHLKEFIKILPKGSNLIVGSDDEVLFEIRSRTKAEITSYGFSRGSSIKITDINVGLGGTNFKISYQGSSVPVWLKKTFGKENIYALLSVVAVGLSKKMNLIEITKAVNGYEANKGSMKLIDGIKNTTIFDNSSNKDVYRLNEAIDLLNKLKKEGRRVSIIGDVFGMGKYTIRGYEEIGSNLSQISDLLITVGPRTNFIALAAKKSGMTEENVFHFNDYNEFKACLKDKIIEKDFIFIDGSCDIQMEDIVKIIKKDK